jgi:hypothetical protein
MRFVRLLWIPIALIVSIAGFVTGRTLGWPRFAEADWPRRGSGPQLIEYFDPACAWSRAFHGRLDELAAKMPRVEHVLVPVSISRGSAPTDADRLCAVPRDRVFEVARAWAKNGVDLALASEAGLDVGRLASCAGKVELATRHTATLNEDRAPTAPLATLGGHTYVGLTDLPALEAALGDLR